MFQIVGQFHLSAFVWARACRSFVHAAASPAHHVTRHRPRALLASEPAGFMARRILLRVQCNARTLSGSSPSACSTSKSMERTR